MKVTIEQKVARVGKHTEQEAVQKLRWMGCGFEKGKVIFTPRYLGIRGWGVVDFLVNQCGYRWIPDAGFRPRESFGRGGR
jgi:hypothetical protein